MLMNKRTKTKLNKSYPKTGFTLIELLVVMAILAILATVGLASFRTTQMKGRDARRKNDLGQIQKALEMYYNDDGQYPLTGGLPGGGGSWEVDGETLYMKEVPEDPKWGDYQYASAGGSDYRLYARLENTNDSCFANPGRCNLDGFDGTSCGDSECNYMVTSPNISL